MSYPTTILPDYVGLVQQTTLNFYANSTNILNAIGDYKSEINQCIEFEKAKVTPNYIKSLGNLFNALNKSNFIVDKFNENNTPEGKKQLDNIFKLYFIEKYQSLSNDYKAKVNEFITNNVYFTNFSDDIAYIADTQSVMDNNVSPYYDFYNSQYFNSSNLPPTLFTKVSVNELAISKTMTLFSDPILKRNLAGLQYDVGKYTAASAHGENLVTDVLYYDRIYVQQINILKSLKAILGNLSSFVIFFKLLNPKDLDPNRKAIFYKYIADIENVNTSIDCLKQEIDTLQLSSEEVLGT